MGLSGFSSRNPGTRAGYERASKARKSSPGNPRVAKARGRRMRSRCEKLRRPDGNGGGGRRDDPSGRGRPVRPRTSAWDPGTRVLGRGRGHKATRRERLRRRTARRRHTPYTNARTHAHTPKHAGVTAAHRPAYPRPSARCRSGPVNNNNVRRTRERLAKNYADKKQNRRRLSPGRKKPKNLGKFAENAVASNGLS